MLQTSASGKSEPLTRLAKLSHRESKRADLSPQGRGTAANCDKGELRDEVLAISRRQPAVSDVNSARVNAASDVRRGAAARPLRGEVMALGNQLAEERCFRREARMVHRPRRLQCHQRRALLPLIVIALRHLVPMLASAVSAGKDLLSFRPT